jgi:hypothetical protein
MNKIVKVLVVLFLSLNCVWAADGPPEFMTYQGHLVNAQGVAVGTDGPESRLIEFRIFDKEQGGNTLYSESQTVTVDKGYFSVLLGQGAKIPGEQGPPDIKLSSIFKKDDKSSDRYIGIRVNGTDINPRLRYVASPYAMLSARAINSINSEKANQSIKSQEADLAKLATKATLADKATFADKAAKADFSTNSSLADKAKEVLNGSVPKYGIIMWTQRNIPDGWRLCDGGGSTPNLINRFVVGAGSWYKLGNTGGANTVTLNWNQLPKHSHSGGTYGGGNHYHGIYTRQDDWNDSGGWGPSWGDGDNGRWAPHHTTHWGGHHSHSIYTHNSGRSYSVENRPPYYAVYYIMRVK